MKWFRRVLTRLFGGLPWDFSDVTIAHFYEYSCNGPDCYFRIRSTNRAAFENTVLRHLSTATPHKATTMQEVADILEPLNKEER